MNNISKSRRAFFLQGGAALSAGVATAVAAAPASKTQPSGVDVGTLQQRLALAEDREAIRKLHLAETNRLESQPGDAPTDGRPVILQLRPNHLQQADILVFSEDRLQASARYHVDAALGTALLGDSTVAIMARLQGQLADRHWETGLLEANYVKVQGQWRLVSMNYLAT